MRKSRKELPDAAALDRLHRQRTRNWKEEFKYDAVRCPLPALARPAAHHGPNRQARRRPEG